MSLSNSPFDPDFQHDEVRAKLVASVEKVNQGFRSLLWQEATSHGLSPIQIQLIVYLRFHESIDCRVGNLASQFDLTVATISGVLSTLVKKELVIKKFDPDDRRARVIHLTARGSNTADRLAAWADIVMNFLKGSSSEFVCYLTDHCIIVTCAWTVPTISPRTPPAKIKHDLLNPCVQASAEL